MTDELLEEITVWLLEKRAWGHIDDIPEHLLKVLLKSPDLSMAAAGVLLHASRCKERDDWEEVFSQPMLACDELNRAMNHLRQWLVAERLRRMGKLRILNDMLLTELVRSGPDCLGDANGKPLRGEFTEVENGKVRFVGQEIDLCQA